MSRCWPAVGKKDFDKDVFLKLTDSFGAATVKKNSDRLLTKHFF